MFQFRFALPQQVKEYIGTTRGQIYIETKAGEFPCKGWEDAIISDMIHWIGNLILMLDPKYNEDSTNNYFMDGPYYFILDRNQYNYLRVRFIQRKAESEVEPLTPVELHLTDYANELLGAGQALLNECFTFSFGKDKERFDLERSISVLQKLL